MYIPKQIILNAYKELSRLTNSPETQGATQITSAIKYLLALDAFYKTNNRPCDTTQKNDKDEFIKAVGNVVTINEECYTKNFERGISEGGNDYKVGSNFFSVNVVAKSGTSAGRFNYPSRSHCPLFYVQEKMLYREADLYKNLIPAYIGSNALLFALVLWLLRKSPIEDMSYNSLRNALLKVYTEDLVNVIFTNEIYEASHRDFFKSEEGSEEVATITQGEILSLFAGSTYNLKIAQNILYYGVPGVGKSYEIEQKLKGTPEGQKERITFHPDYSYGEFVGQLLPQKKGDSIAYEFVPGAFTRILKKALTNPDKHYYFIIEEINRGNASAIFGDVFQLLDRDDTNGESKYKIQNKDIQESLGDIGVNMADGIYIPGNLSIYATMNTCDQNVFVLDTAFKRRWIYRYVQNPECEYGDTLVPGSFITWQEFLDTINEKICEAAKDSAIDEDKQLGAYFISKALLTDKEFAKENFADKVLMYLWSDVVRFDRSILFSENFNSFNSLRTEYMNCTPENFTNLFAKGVFV